jgi:hypothetical protein
VDAVCRMRGAVEAGELVRVKCGGTAGYDLLVRAGR